MAQEHGVQARETKMRVRFSETMTTDLLRNKRGAAREWLMRLNSVGMEIQSEPRPGRVNVRFRLDDTAPWSYRTYAAQDLVAVDA